MSKIRVLTLAAASAAFIGLGGAAMAQNVSGGDPYSQGFADGQASQKQNNLNAFNSGIQAAQQSQDADTAAKVQAYNNGFQAGVAQSSSSTAEAYSHGYQDRATLDQRQSVQAFNKGYDVGANQQADVDANYPQ